MQNNVMPNNVTEFSTYEEIVAKQKSIETQNEGMIRNIINQISCSMTDEKSFLEFTKQIKDYRNNIFKAKLGVNDINSAYMKREKNTPDQTLEMLNSRTILSGLSVKNFIYGYKMPQRVFNRAIEKLKSVFSLMLILKTTLSTFGTGKKLFFETLKIFLISYL